MSWPHPLEVQRLKLLGLQLRGGGLEGADIGHDHPAVFGTDAVVVAEHRAVAVADHVVKMRIRSRAQAIDVKRRGRRKAAMDDHAVAISQTAVACRAIDVEA